MDSLIGNAVTLDGDTIRVTFEGEFAVRGTLAHIVSINTQMDGGGEYSPLKQTTASISCLVDGAELMRLCVSEQPVSVLVENVEQGIILFKGYVVPNSYNQALSGINDTITIECVDCLGYAKYVNYERGETFSVMTLATLFDNIAVALGIDEVRIPNDAGLVDITGNSTARYDLLTVSDNMFYKSINPEDIDGELLYEPVAMTYAEVLRMIAESLRLTWVQVGSILYLADDVNIATSPDRVMYRRPNGFALYVGSEHNIVEESFATTICNVSSLPRYSRVVINHAEGNGRAIQPALFEYSHLRRAGEVYTEDVTDSEGEVTTRAIYQGLASMTYDVILDNHAMVVGYKTYDAEETVSREAYNESWETCLRLTPDPENPVAIPVARCKKQYCGAIVPNAGRGIRVDLEIDVSLTDAKWWPHNVHDFADGRVFGDLRLEVKSITSDGTARYFNAYSAKWQAEQHSNIIYFIDGSTYVFSGSAGTIDAMIMSGNVIPSVWNGSGEGTIEVTLLARGGKNTGWKAVYIKRFDVVEAEFRTWSREYPNPTSKVQSRGQWKLNEVQEVTLPIDNYYYMSDKAFGNLIADNIYKDIIIGGDSMIDRVWKQANLGDRLMWEMALRDEANAITALDAFTCAQLWSGRKVVAGYARDIINNSITLTLI